MREVIEKLSLFFVKKIWKYQNYFIHLQYKIKGYENNKPVL